MNEIVDDAASPALVSLRRGSLRLSRGVYDTYFAGLDAVVLLAREGNLNILPVRHAGGGGHLLKTLNSAGDRVIHAGDLLRIFGVREELLEGDEEGAFSARWSSDAAALVVEGLLPTD